ncbi:MAG TPA: hypothetical protein VKB88_37520 [Bryobacteraceae bacterium]|nr:hypothetical protein [Bryobacteraceae bacterium]
MYQNQIEIRVHNAANALFMCYLIGFFDQDVAKAASHQGSPVPLPGTFQNGDQLERESFPAKRKKLDHKNVRKNFVEYGQQLLAAQILNFVYLFRTAATFESAKFVVRLNRRQLDEFHAGREGKPIDRGAAAYESKFRSLRRRPRDLSTPYQMANTEHVLAVHQNFHNHAFVKLIRIPQRPLHT